MTAALLAAAALAAGYALGRWRPAHRASDWANWQKYRTPHRHSPRWWAVWLVLSAENLTWLAAHPVQGVDAWRHRNDPPRTPAPNSPPRGTRPPTRWNRHDGYGCACRKAAAG